MFKLRVTVVRSTALLSKRALSSQHNDVLFEELNNAGIISLNRPKIHNAFNLSMIKSIRQQLKDWQNKKTLVIIKGNGGKAFCAGGDLVGISESYDNQLYRNSYTLNYEIANCKLPYVALLNGIVMGGGLGLSVNGQYRVATERTVAAVPEIKLGVVPDSGATHYLPRLPRNVGSFLGLTGHIIKGNDAYKAGIATHYIPSERLPELEKLLTKCSSDAEVANVLQKFHEPSDTFSLTPYMDDIEHCFSASSLEQIIQRLETVNNDWSRNLIKILYESCPGALSIAFRALQFGAKLDLADCLRMEFRVACHIHCEHDGPEGVRKVLVEKVKPRWQHAKLTDVESEYVDNHFRKVPDEDDLQLP